MSEISKLNLKQKVSCQIIRTRRTRNKLIFNNPFHIEHFRLFDKDKPKVKIAEYNIFNGITDVGLNKLLDVMFNGSTPIANNSWFVGQINAAGFTALSDADTMASHAGWAEFTGYTQSTRVAWGSGAAAAREVTNSSPLTFTFSAAGTLQAVFVASVATKGATTGILWATAEYDDPVPVAIDDELRAVYSVGG